MWGGKEFRISGADIRKAREPVKDCAAVLNVIDWLADERVNLVCVFVIDAHGPGCIEHQMIMMMMMMDELLSCHKVQGTARTRRNSKMCHAVMSVQWPVDTYLTERPSKKLGFQSITENWQCWRSPNWLRQTVPDECRTKAHRTEAHRTKAHEDISPQR